jgi:hypothetical protein
MGRVVGGREQVGKVARRRAVDTDRDDPGVIPDRDRVRDRLPGGS